MSVNTEEYEYESVSDYESEDECVEEHSSSSGAPKLKEIQKKEPNKEAEVTPDPPKKVKKPMRDDDKRKNTSAKNLEKARQVRLERIRAQKEAAAAVVQLETSSDEEEQETELVVKKQRKPAIVSRKDEIERLKLEVEKQRLENERLMLHAKRKSKPKTIMLQNAPGKPKEKNLQVEQIKRSIIGQ